MTKFIFMLVLAALTASAQDIPLKSVRKIYIDTMPNHLDQYLRAFASLKNIH